METRRISLQRVIAQTDSNAGLWLDKFIKGQNVESDDARSNDEKPFKNQLIDEVTKIETPGIYEKFFDRWLESLNAVEAKFKSIKIEGRIAVGLGAESVMETSIALHRTYGVPFISGSALKGLAASYAHKHLGNDWNKETKTTKLGKAHEFVFGSQDSAGFLTFHDALLMPKIKNPLHADIMTVHHTAYYGDKNLPPADWDSPVPIPFLSANGNYLAAISANVEGADEWIEFIWLILEKALQKEGIGAKTSSGYGRAKLTDDYPKTARMEKLEEAQKEIERKRILDKIEEDEENERIKKEHHQAEIAAQIEAKKQVEIEQQQESKEKLIKDIFEQIKAVNAATRKPEDLFDKLSSNIYKVKDDARKRAHYVSAYAELERLTNEGLKIATADKSGKPFDWFKTLVKMNKK